MRAIIAVCLLLSIITVDAQIPSSLNVADYHQRGLFENNNFPLDSSGNKKWFFNTYSSISTGFYFFNGGGATYIASPIGLQLSRMLNKNLYAFAGISAAPAYINFNHSFLSADANKIYPNNFYNSNYFGVSSRAELGLMYINDAKTFSISGSIGVQSSNYPFLPYYQSNTGQKNNAILKNR